MRRIKQFFLTTCGTAATVATKGGTTKVTAGENPRGHSVLTRLFCLLFFVCHGLAGATGAWAAPYSGTPTTPLQITAGNYTDYGFTADNYSDFVGYYGIRTAEELYGFASLVNGGTNTINGVLTADIVVNENVLNANGGLNGTPAYTWNPIGVSAGSYSIRAYRGTFDGNGHTISGLYYKNTNNSSFPNGGNYVGLFGYTMGTIKNVGLVDSYIHGYDYVGGICGNEGTIINCYNTGTVVIDKVAAYAGGICGRSGTQINCYNAGIVSGHSNYMGGICGGDGTQSNCYTLNGIFQGRYTSTTRNGTLATADEFASGKIAYLLNGKTSEGEVAWYQNLETNADALPTLNSTHGKVYGPSPCFSILSFNNSAPVVNNHVYDENGFCSACGEYMPATLVTNDNYAALHLTENHIGYYAIENAVQLNWFADMINNKGNLAFNGVLVADIVVNENMLNSDGELNGTPAQTWTPIGGVNKQYGGTFDGNGHTISGLYVNTSQNYAGLFGYVNEAKIKNIGVINSYILGSKSVGGICGYGYGSTSISNCYYTGVVSGSQFNVGGIIGDGYGAPQTQISNCYNIGRVSGQYYVGGISGTSLAFTNCYYLEGCATDGSGVTQCGYGTSESGQTTSDFIGKTVSATSAEFASGKITYLLNGSVSGGNTWYQTLNADIIPSLDKTHGSLYIASPCSIFTNTYNLTKNHVWNDYGQCDDCGENQPATLVDGIYQIANPAQLYWFAELVNSGMKNAKGELVADIVVNSNVLNADGSLNGTPEHVWTPIGTNNHPFTGVFDGNGHTISGLYFKNNRDNKYPDGGTYVGLFGYAFDAFGYNVTGRGIIKNVGVVDSYIDGGYNVGGISGCSGEFTNCYYEGIVLGTNMVGGICGYGYTGSCTNCHSIGGFSGDSYIGGISGNPDFEIINCYTIGYVEEKNNITACGNWEITVNYEVPEGKTLLVPANATVTTIGDAVITNNGTIIANGSISGNDLAGEGVFKYNQLANGDVALTTTSFVYRSSVYTLDDDVEATISNRTFCGKTFTFDDSQTSISYENNRNVGNNATVTWTNTNGSSVSKTFSITPKTLAISNIAAASKTYDGNTTTTVSYTVDVFSGDDVTFGTAATFDNKNAGTGKQVTFNYTKSGADAANYAFANESGSTTANIEPRELAISSVSAAGKEYDGNTATTVTIAASNIVSGDVVTFGTAAAFENKNAGENKTVNFNFTKSGTDAANYSFANATGTAKANITARTLTLSNFVANGKTYDGTTNATGGAFSDNRVSGDVLGFTYDYSFENKDVGTNKNVNFSNIAISGGADKGNYTLAATTGVAKADITVKTLAISNIKAESKTYDGNTTTTVSYTTDKVATDDVTFGTTATFADKNVGNGKAVSFDYTKSGADAANYAFANESGSTTANIEPRELAISSVSAASKEYNGNTATTVTIAASNIVSGDVVTFGTAAAFADKNVGTNKTVNFTYTKSGADAANYSFAQANGTAKANITARTLTLSNIVANGKTYDGTTNATGGAFSDNRISGDALEFSFDYAFADKNAANAVAVKFGNIAISGGADKDNYSLLTTTGTCNAQISPVTDEVAITITLADKSVVYSGAEQTYNAADALTIEADNALYNLDWVSESGNAASVSGTNAGEYAFGWNAEMFSNSSANFTNVTFNVTDGKLIITPTTNVVVTITENSKETAYNTEEQSVSGYSVDIEDETNVYSETDFTFSGNAVAAGTTVGTYPMDLSAADFSNTNTNFANVTFNIVDGALTINKAAEAPNKPAAIIETRYIVTQLVALPENWKWADEQQALVMGSNTATANYTGADKGNYEIESVEVTIIRGECLHNEGNEILYTLEPTCTRKGYTGNLSCKLCGEIYEMGDSIPALGHDFVNTVIAPTCTTEGYTEHLCNRCQHIEYSDTVAATGHKADNVVFENVVAATCTAAGSYDSVVYCSVCRVELSRDVVDVPATGHKADSVAIENIVAATRTAAGSYDSVVYCSVCRVELSRTTIEVPQIVAETIKLASKPNKVEYKQGEALDVKGGKITIGYSDKSTEDYEILPGWVSGFNSEKVGKQTLTISFEAVSSTLTTTFDVTVSAKDDDNTAVDEDAANMVNIYAYQNVIVVENANAEIYVYDAMGRLVERNLGNDSCTEIRMNNAGVYIVKVGNVAKRVMVY